jgi:transcriptional regulator with GAF, ATPase, and Fis domain
MAEEILNIEHHIKHLVVKAMNKFKNNRAAAAEALQISLRQLHIYKRQFNIKYDPSDNQYFLKQNK